MTRSFLSDTAAAVLAIMFAAPPALSQVAFQGGVSVSAGDIGKATASDSLQGQRRTI